MPFEFFEEGDLNAYVDGTLKTITTDYTVSGGSGSTGTIAMTVVGASGGSTVVLTRSIPLERTTDFPTSGPFDVTSLNEELDRITAINADLNDEVNRSLRLTDADAAANLTLPTVASRAGKVLAFDLTTGDLVNGPSTAGVTTVAAAAADIATLADIQDGTVATNAITDAAAIKTNITTVAGIAANVTTVAGNTANVNTVAGINADVTTVASNNANVTTVAGISGNVTTAAGISADITAVAADATDIGTVSTNIANVNTVAGISADVTTVAADGTDIGVVAGISSDVTTVSGIAANVTSVAGNTTNINAVAADATDIGTVATNIANVNTAAGISANITTVAGIAADVTAAATNATDISAIAAEVAKVVTVANDLNEATSEIDTVANSIANVDLVGADIANVNTVATNLTNVNAFADTYFIGATAPSSPTSGDLWFDTSVGVDTMKVYGASGWQNAGSSVNGTSQRVTYTATASQTSFAATYDAGYVDVYLNGIKLIDGTDFTATSGTSVVLTTGAALNDTVEIVGFGTFSISNFSINDANDVNTTGVTNGQALLFNSTSGDFEAGDVDALPSQTGNSGKYLTTDGSLASWGTVATPTLSSLGIANHDQVTVTAGGAVTATSYAGDGSALTGVEAFASGTLMLFQQTAAPTGWTKQTSHNDKALRIVSGSVGTGGSVAFSTAFATPAVTGSISGSTGSTTLATSQIPSHSHSISARAFHTQATNIMAMTNTSGSSGTGSTSAAGGGGSHNHTLSATFSSGAAAINVEYVDLIIASKD